VEGFDVEVEQRRKLGLPADVLAAVGWRPGNRVQIQVRRDGRVVIVPLTELLDRYTGAVPGLTEAVKLDKGRDE
jgi:bifunctional DNA-binding transcriptional regulator/antitoxin component of YhaV-PrlF toxin-antitoxin module